MYVLHIKFSKKYAACCGALAVMIAAAVILLSGCLKKDVAPQVITAADNAARVAYLQQQGWSVTEEPIETLDLVLPEDLSADYADYCKLQSEQELPFSQYAGQQVTRYTYVVTNYPNIERGVQANLYVCGEQIIAGDIIATGEGGFQQGLAFPDKADE